jgi:hypothetical protein
MSITSTMYKNIAWNKTSNFSGQRPMDSFKHQVYAITGNKTYGNGHGKEKYAHVNLLKFLERAVVSDMFLEIPSGKIMTEDPTDDMLVDLLVSYMKNDIAACRLNIEDRWAALSGSRVGDPMCDSNGRQNRILKDGPRPRFVDKPVSKKEYMKVCTSNEGMLSEGFVVTFLNKKLKCPECGVKGQIGWCTSHDYTKVDSFRDSVCMSCKQKGINTLFEIKCRWESKAALSNEGISAGSYVALNSLMAMRANVWIVVVSKDTGNIRIGKINRAEIAPNKNWLFFVQHELGCAGPSSKVFCHGGLRLAPITMKPLTKSLNSHRMKRIAEASIDRIDRMEALNDN